MDPNLMGAAVDGSDFKQAIVLIEANHLKVGDGWFALGINPPFCSP